MHQLEPETAGEFERGMMGHARNTRRRAETGQNQSGQPLGTDAAKAILPLSKVQTSNQTVNTMFFRGLQTFWRLRKLEMRHQVLPLEEGKSTNSQSLRTWVLLKLSYFVWFKFKV